MVGLTIVLKSEKVTTTATTSIINKAITIIIKKPTPPPSFKPTCSFLDQCFLCQLTLLPTKDIYMYKGDIAFCSVECRGTQISMDEKMNETAAPKSNNRRDKCSLAAMKPPAVMQHHHLSEKTNKNKTKTKP